MSFVSLFADMTYEGARSISGAYLEVLGASLIVAGGISLGELVSYVARLAGGVIAHFAASSLAYWAIVISGYTINLVAVPLLAFAGSWEAAFTLYILERVGKGLRVPVRDTIIAEVSSGIGRGKAFAFHELLDQVGGVAGPLVVAYSIASHGGSYREAFIVLAVPAAASIILLLAASIAYPRISSAQRLEVGLKKAITWKFTLYALGIALAMASFIHWGQASYILSEIGGEQIALLYALVMAVDGLAAIPLGMAFDRWGLRVSLIIPLLTAAATLNILNGNIIAFTLAWGVSMGALEVLPKAAVAELVEARARSLAYSMLFISMGLGWTIGNIVMACALPDTMVGSLTALGFAAASLIVLAAASRL
ncbi:MAG: MFS transporter [Thermoprotei archaeon]|nr:MFS transporter [Thermoprotei archaeon]